MRCKKILLFFLIFISIMTKTFSTDVNMDTEDEILNNQKESFGISGFISQAEKYSKDNFEGLNMDQILNSAISGNVDNNSIFNKIINLFAKEIKSMLKILRHYINNNCYT